MQLISAADYRQMLEGAGECGALIAARGWSGTPLGAIEAWPTSLRTMLLFVLRSPVPIVMLWGESGVMLYNDAYSVFAGGRHPDLLGSNVREGWPEVADFNDNVMRVGLAGGTLAYRDQELTLYRHGCPEQVFMSLDYSPVPGDDGRPAGVLAVVIETTGRIAAERSAAAERERHRLALQHMPGFAALLSGPEHRFDFVNDAYVELCGDRSYLGRTAREVFPEVAGQGLFELLDQVYRTGEPLIAHAMPILLDRQDGERFVDILNHPVRDDQGRVTGIFVGGNDVTDQVRSARALSASEQRYRQIVEGAEDFAIIVQDPHGVITSWNTGAERIMGWSAGEAIGRRAVFIFTPEDQANGVPDHELNRAHSDGRALNERWHMRRDGSRFWGSGLTMRIDQPEPGYLKIFRDRTAEHEAEARIRELNETLERRVAEALAERQVFADLVETSTAAILVLDTDYRILAINKANVDAFERVYGKRPKVGDNLLLLLTDMPEHQTQVARTWARALAGEEFTLIDEFGDQAHERSTFDVRFTVMRDREGHVIGAAHMAYDISDRARAQAEIAAAEAAKREADALYRAYFTNTAEALFVIGITADGGFSIEELNPAYEASTGLALAQVTGRRVEEVLPAAAAAAVSARYRRIIETGEAQSYRETLELAGGTRHWDTVLVPVQDNAGRVIRIVGSGRDVTAQVHAEEALRQSRKMEAMGQLTGGVAHDFNNLLTPIVGSLDMLQRRGVGDERDRRLITSAAASAERARILVQRLLAFARRQPLQTGAVDVAALVHGMGELIASTTGPQIKVAVEAPADLPPARADANQLEMALLNLAVNARDAMADGGTLRITGRVEDVGQHHRSGLPPGSYVCLSVADTGVGMDLETQRRAIEPFFSTKGVGRGTGLGLSMAHGLASQLGGALTIRSSPGVGTDIELWLPPAEPAPQRDEGEHVARVPDSSRACGTVLLVDDEEAVRLSTAEMLAALGYDVVEAADAEQALALLKTGRLFALLMTDHLMPGMNGNELATAVHSVCPDLPVLLVSGYAEEGGIDAAIPRLSKPFRQDELAVALARITTPMG